VKDIEKEQQQIDTKIKQKAALKDVHINKLETQIKDIEKDHEKAETKV